MGKDKEGDHSEGALDQALDRLGGLLGRGLRLHEPERDQQGTGGCRAQSLQPLPGFEKPQGELVTAEVRATQVAISSRTNGRAFGRARIAIWN